MTKIISGKYKGRSLIVPPSVTRPTSSRVREAVFSSAQHILGDFLELRVLDLFAGSGAIGLEALSRGASNCVFVEKDAVAVTCINQNARTLTE
ncbi:MAG: 16S rRNA (guanine(966)-N(2))-methyltransferase RsmD, partial [Actinobacteria bacterium]|nr:16S rRNA (guanine(966)-N(2))-methyltransferase RsmD [Actinomycetota bacterium]